MGREDPIKPHLGEEEVLDDTFCGERSCRKVALLTLGCKINQYDTNSIVADIQGQGHALVSTMTDADVIVVNTCTVTGKTDYKGRQSVRRAVQQNPEAVLMVTGCYAEVQPRRLADIPGVDYVLGNAEKANMAWWISHCCKQVKPVVRSGDHLKTVTLDSGPPLVHSGTTRAFLKIQDGCDHHCTYCIIPRARGRSRSLDPDQLWEKMHLLAEKGFREVILCGIHLGAYGLDLQPPTRLIHVLERLEQEAPVPRIRISSIEPNELHDNLIRLFGRAAHLCHHFHLPLQSGDAGVLKAMNRPYGPGDFVERVTKIRTGMPEAAVGVDVIAGFPGESDEAFEQTAELLESLPVSYLHVFPYSARPGTPASQFPNPVPPEVIHNRAKLLRKMSRDKRLKFYGQFVDQELEVLVETKRDPTTGMLKGVSRNYVPVLFEGPDAWQKRLISVKIRSVNEKVTFGGVENQGKEPSLG